VHKQQTTKQTTIKVTTKYIKSQVNLMNQV